LLPKCQIFRYSKHSGLSAAPTASPAAYLTTRTLEIVMPTTGPVRAPIVDVDALEADSPLMPMVSFIRKASGGRLLNMHLQMAAAPVVLAQYTALRRAIGEYASLDLLTRAAIAVAASAASDGEYSLAVNRQLAVRAGWTPPEVQAIAEGRTCGDPQTDAVLEVVRDAAARDGTVANQSWKLATAAGWTPAQLTEVYGYLALASYCDRFVRFAGTENDLAYDADRG
jgi:hypothetical protein